MDTGGEWGKWTQGRGVSGRGVVAEATAGGEVAVQRAGGSEEGEGEGEKRRPAWACDQGDAPTVQTNVNRTPQDPTSPDDTDGHG